MSAANSDCWNVPSSTSGCGTAISLQGFIRSCSGSLKKVALLFGWHQAGGGFDSGPAGDEFVVRPGIFGPALTLAQSIEPVRKLAGSFCFTFHCCKDVAGAGFALLFQ